MPTTTFNAALLRQAVESAPDYAAAKAEQDRLYALKIDADAAYTAASERVNHIWDREADRLFSPPTATEQNTTGPHICNTPYGPTCWCEQPAGAT